MNPSPRQLVFASNNLHKLSEIRRMAGDKFRILSLEDIGCHDDIPETADTIEGNSSNSCRERRYPIGHYEIYGYGTPAY